MADPMTPSTLRTRITDRWRALPGWVRTPARIAVFAVLGLTLLAAVPYGWVRAVAAGHLYEESALTGGDGPRADVLLVLGAQVEPDGTDPSMFLKGRLDTAAALYRTGVGRVVLVSGDAHGGSGNETAVMTSYLQGQGIPTNRIVTDPSGLDTYDSCARAAKVYGVGRALVVTQAYHLARAVALCRRVGIDADGVAARCDGCGPNIPRNAVRDYFAATKAAWDAFTNRQPSVLSPRSTAVADALAQS